MNTLPIRILFVASLSLAIGLDGLADDPKEAVAHYLAELQKRNDAIHSRLEAVSTAIEEAEKSGALTPAAAEAERNRVSQAKIAKIESFETKSPSRPAALSAAWTEFSNALEARMRLRDTERSAMIETVVTAANAAWRGAKHPEDLTASLELLESIKGDAQQGHSYPAMNFGFSVDATLSNLTRAQKLLAALDAGDPAEVARQMAPRARFPMMGRPFAAPGSEIPDWAKWLDGLADERRAETKKLGEQFEGLVARRAPLAEVAPVADRFDALTAMIKALEGEGEGGRRYGFGVPNVKPSVSPIRAWTRILEAIDRGDWNGAEQAAAVAELSEGRVSEAMLRAVTEKREEIAKRKVQELRERLAKVTDGDSARRLAEELRREEAGPGRSVQGISHEVSDRTALRKDLLEVASMFAGETPGGSLDAPGRSLASASWAPEIQTLQDRALRTAAARRLSCPELLQPPLNGMALSPALRQLERDLFAKSDWTRLYQLLSGTASKAEAEAAQGIKAYVTGQNLEKAGQYAEAIQSYRSVLSCVGELVPVAAAAERLRALKREHPEAAGRGE